jgi:putative transposase
VKRHLLASYRS